MCLFAVHVTQLYVCNVLNFSDMIYWYNFLLFQLLLRLFKFAIDMVQKPHKTRNKLGNYIIVF